MRLGTIYLIRDGELIKIGYANDVFRRMKQHETSNKHLKYISSMGGTIQDERNLHRLCKDYQYDNEWYYYNEAIIDIFKNYKSILLQLKIKDRGKLEQFDKNGKYIATWSSIKQASLVTNITSSSISKCLKGNYKTAGGYIWKWTS